MKLQHLFQLFILPVLLFSPLGNSGRVRAGVDVNPEPSVTTFVNPAYVNIGETAVVSVSLNNIPIGGYAGAEFTCTYNANLLEASNIVATELFGRNAVTAINDPQSGTFILAVAGSNGNKTTSSGNALTFNIKGLQAGRTAIECIARVSKGDNALLVIPSIGTSFIVLGSVSSTTPFTPTVTPNGPTATPMPGVAFDFVANACLGIWFSGAGQLPCPGTDLDVKGFVLKLDHPIRETGSVDTRPGLLTTPQNIYNGTIQGSYPPFKVQSGDRFRSTIGCEGGATNCYVVFRLDYQIGSGPINTFWAFVEKYEGIDYSADIDLSPLAGQDVRFILTILSNGPSAWDDRALWVAPIIYRADANSTPVPPSDSTITGQVLAGKPVTISLYRADDSLAAAVSADSAGRFNFTVPAGTYSVVATASGTLSARGTATLTSESANTVPTVSLPAGDIDNNNVVDQFDALTIGMNYNTIVPAAADLNNDGIINVLDLELLARSYRKVGPLVWQ